MDEKKSSARHRCNRYRASTPVSGEDGAIIQQFERGSLIASVIMALSFGAATLMWAVVA